MTIDLTITLVLLAAAMLGFTLNKPRSDVIALLLMLLFPLTGVLTLSQSLAGFSEPAVLLIALLFVIGEALVRTGVVYRLGDYLVKYAGNSENRLLVLLMLAVATLSAVMSSTGVVAIFIPVVLSIAAKLKLSPAPLLMPLAFSALIGGMLTLVATPPNMVVNAELQRAGEAGFSFFAFAPIGLIVLILGIGYMLLAKRFLSPAVGQNTGQDSISLSGLAEQYRLTSREFRLQVQPHSPLVNQPLNTLGLRSEYGINVVAVERPARLRSLLLVANSQTVIQAGDVLLVDLAAASASVLEASAILGLSPQPLHHSYYSLHAHQLGLVEVALPPDSALAGKSIQQIGFRSRYRLNIVGIKRKGEALLNVLPDEVLQQQDTLLLAGSWSEIRRLQQHRRDLLLLSLPAESNEATPTADRAPYAIGSVLLMIALMVSGIVPTVLAALITALVLGACRCIDLNNAYKAVHWPSLLLIVGMLPFAQALQQTGGINLAVSGVLQLAGNQAPLLMLACVFIITMLFSLVISNTATAVLMAPVALSLASALNASPYPFAMMVALGASTAFMTPIASPVNLLVMGPGQYRFIDFLKIGSPFTLLVLMVSLLLVPLFFPL